ncbi:STAS domain-containing protein [Rhodococcus maanshanensis]|uniref:Anti-sigma B factor antagonist n=1 Tax=Rhodococcus maanshanensis TaxID=183556 RepID=A0A1H7LSL4_9NOCA|nr:STAS domain-containing protein [Rhodococcus maanshanensis]SEL01912.1 anti-sigma B factor antagonist [Rhodococcus maanshanensis]
MPELHRFEAVAPSTGPVGTPTNGRSPVVVPLSGEVDAAALRTVDEQLGVGIETAEHVLVVDLSEVTFLSIRGAEALAAAQWRAGADGVEFCLVTASDAVDRTLRVTQLDKRFRRFPSVASAIAQIHRDRPLSTVGAPLGGWRAVS